MTAAPDEPAAALAGLAAELHDLGVGRIHVLGWRDLDDPEAGGSEVHADHVLRRWAAAGLDVVHRTSAAEGQPAESVRHGYRVVRRGGRYDVFARAAAAEVAGRHHGRADALVEIWNGVPWLGPVWFRGPRVVWLHHVHGPMWDQIFPRPLAAAGRLMETRLAPPLYRRSRVVTLADASRDELGHLGFRRVEVVPPGIDASFSPGGTRSAEPLVVAVGRLAPVKRPLELLEACAQARREVPDLRLVVVGDGPLRDEVATRVTALDAGGWVTLAGRVDHASLVDLYRRAWVVASASLAEGWGMTLTEAAACATPCVVTDNVGHRGAVGPGAGVIVPEPAGIGPALAAVLSDGRRRSAMAAAALDHAATLTWDRTAHDTLAVLVDEVRARR